MARVYGRQGFWVGLMEMMEASYGKWQLWEGGDKRISARANGYDGG